MKNKKRLIDANALLKEIDFEYDLGYGEILTDPKRFAEMVDDAPTVDAVEVVHGRWIELPSLIGLPWKVQCDQCGCPQDYKHNYCPNCGAKMDGE